MDEKPLRKITLWLEIIADELYVARTDKEMDGASGSGPDLWNDQGRDYMVNGIEKMRELAGVIVHKLVALVLFSHFDSGNGSCIVFKRSLCPSEPTLRECK